MGEAEMYRELGLNPTHEMIEEEKKELLKEMEEFNRKEEAKARVHQGLKMIAQAVELIRG